jgi:hypothetical protein
MDRPDVPDEVPFSGGERGEWGLCPDGVPGLSVPNGSGVFTTHHFIYTPTIAFGKGWGANCVNSYDPFSFLSSRRLGRNRPQTFAILVRFARRGGDNMVERKTG